MRSRTRSKVRPMFPLEALEARAVPASGALAPAALVTALHSIDGTGNNLANPSWGAAGTDFSRISIAAYADGVGSPAGADRPSARAVSNAIADGGGQDVLSDRQLSAMLYAWGQFLDHDLDLTRGGTGEALPIAVPTGDPAFDPAGTGTKVIPLTRSGFDPTTGQTTPRQQVNTISGWLDGSMIYGSDATTAAALRSFEGGHLKLGADGLLPSNDAATFPGGTLPMANDAHRVPNDELFAAGDVRANENIELTALQTLFVREHNRWADVLHARNPGLNDEVLYQQARARVIGELQAITYNEWLPTLLGPDALPRYAGYQPTVDPTISTEFATAAFRFGHSLLGDDIEFLDNSGVESADGVGLKDAFSNPDLVRANGIDPLLKYLASDPASEIDTQVVDSVRNFLFGPPGSGGFDLASLNIQRGRDHGLADYNTVRVAVGLPRVQAFSEITSDPALAGKLESLYGTVDNIDLWVGGLAEDHAPGSSVGPTFRAILADQFTRLRDGDRLWYQNVFQGADLRAIGSTSLSDVIRRNTGLTNLQQNLFVFDAAVQGIVFGDADSNGRQGPRERGVPGQTVELLRADDGSLVATTTTDRRGGYAFDVAAGVRTGQFRVRVSPPTGSPQAPAGTTSPVTAVTRGDQVATRNVGVPVPPGGGGVGRPQPGPGRPAAAPPPRVRPAALPRGPMVGTRAVAATEATPVTTPAAVAPPPATFRSRSARTPGDQFAGARRELLAGARAVLGASRFRAFAAGLGGTGDPTRPA